MKKIQFLKALEINLFLFIALFFAANSILAQAYNDYLYDYGDFYTAFAPWDISLLMNYQNYNKYGQNNFGVWPQANFSYNQPWIGLDHASSIHTPSNNQPSFSDAVPGLPNLSSIVFNSGAQAYNIPGWLQNKSSFAVGSILGTYGANGNTWNLWLFPDMPVLYSNGTIKTTGGTSKAKTITIEDDGETFTFSPGEIFRIVLPMYDDVSNEDFSYSNGWAEEDLFRAGYENIYGYEAKSIGLKRDEEDNLVQEMTFRGLWASPNEKELVFNYHSSDDPDEVKDTFRVTIQIQGAGHYNPSY